MKLFFLVFNFKIPTFILLAVLGSFLLKNTFDTNLLYVSPLEKDKLVHRHEYYSQGLGKIYKNRIGIYLNYSVAANIGSRAYFVVKGDKVYRLSLNWFKPQEADYISVFEKMAASLKVK